MNNIPSPLDNEILELCRQGKKLVAVKLHLDATGIGLRESKDYVDKLAAEHGIVTTVMKQKRDSLKTSFKKYPQYYSVLIFVIIVGGFILIFVDKPAAKKEKTEAPAPPPEPLIKVKVDKILSEYSANEVSADIQYKGKKIIVIGVVESIGKTFGVIHVKLSGDRNNNTVDFAMKKSEASNVAKLSNGQLVEIKGKCIGLTIFEDLVMDECKMVSK